jgi:hypothetical protein
VTLLVRSESSSSSLTLRRATPADGELQFIEVLLVLAVAQLGPLVRLRVSMVRTEPRFMGIRWPMVALSA